MTQRATVPITNLDGHPPADQAAILRQAFTRQTAILRRQLNREKREHQATLDALEAARAEIALFHQRLAEQDRIIAGLRGPLSVEHP